jgi:hypothetical protein
MPWGHEEPPKSGELGVSISRRDENCYPSQRTHAGFPFRVTTKISTQVWETRCKDLRFGFSPSVRSANSTTEMWEGT